MSDPNDFDRHPELRFGDKSALQVSGNTVIRKREPTNYHTACKNVNMVFDHSNQNSVVPTGNRKGIVVATDQAAGYRPMNATGRPYALGTVVGGSPDDPGYPLRKGPAAKIIKG
jgi:hypothetical protein